MHISKVEEDDNGGAERNVRQCLAVGFLDLVGLHDIDIPTVLSSAFISREAETENIDSKRAFCEIQVNGSLLDSCTAHRLSCR